MRDFQSAAHARKAPTMLQVGRCRGSCCVLERRQPCQFDLVQRTCITHCQTIVWEMVKEALIERQIFIQQETEIGRIRTNISKDYFWADAQTIDLADIHLQDTASRRPEQPLPHGALLGDQQQAPQPAHKQRISHCTPRENTVWHRCFNHMQTQVVVASLTTSNPNLPLFRKKKVTF